METKEIEDRVKQVRFVFDAEDSDDCVDEYLSIASTAVACEALIDVDDLPPIDSDDKD